MVIRKRQNVHLLHDNVPPPEWNWKTNIPASLFSIKALAPENSSRLD